MPTPAQAAINQSKGATVAADIAFPSTLGEFFMTFDFYDYRTFDTLPQKGTAAAGSSAEEISRATSVAVEPTRNVYSANKDNVRDHIKKSTFARIALPIPANLVDNFKVEWGAEQLGLIAGIASKGYQSGAAGTDALFSAGKGDFAGATTALNNLVGGAIGAVKTAVTDTNDSTVVHMVRRVVAMGSPLFGQVSDIVTGVAENPNLVVLFRGPTLKQHQFTWKLIARTPAESESIKKIIAIFKRAMHPQRLNATTTAFLKYPAECLAEFHSPSSSSSSFLYPLRPTVVEDFSVNYAPNGMPAFHQGTYDTVGVEITVRLQETSYYLRDSFNDSTEFGSDGYGPSDLGRTPTGDDDDEENMD